MTMVTEKRLDNEEIIALVATAFQKETEKSVDVESKRKDGLRKLSEPAYSTGAQYTSSFEQRPSDISDTRKNKTACYKVSEELQPALQPLKGILAVERLRQHILKPERELDVTTLKVIEPANDHFAALVNYHN